MKKKRLISLFWPIFFEILFLMLTGIVDTLMLSGLNYKAVPVGVRGVAGVERAGPSGDILPVFVHTHKASHLAGEGDGLNVLGPGTHCIGGTADAQHHRFGKLLTPLDENAGARAFVFHTLSGFGKAAALQVIDTHLDKAGAQVHSHEKFVVHRITSLDS